MTPIELKSVSRKVVRDLVKDWQMTHFPDPYYCCHGRPIVTRCGSALAVEQSKQVHREIRYKLPCGTVFQVILVPAYVGPTDIIWGVVTRGVHCEIWTELTEVVVDTDKVGQHIGRQLMRTLAGVGGTVEMPLGSVPPPEARHRILSVTAALDLLRDLSGLLRPKKPKRKLFRTNATEALWFAIHQNFSHLEHCCYQVELSEQLGLDRRRNPSNLGGLSTAHQMILDNIKMLIQGYQDTTYSEINFDRVNFEDLSGRFLIQYSSTITTKFVPNVSFTSINANSHRKR